MAPKLFDIHSHLNFPDFNKDREDVIKRMRENGIWTICVGADKKTSQECVDLAEKYEGVYASVGLHPTDSDEKFDAEYYKNLAKHLKVVAIGETGLDYYRSQEARNPKSEIRNKQIKIFEKQIELAIEINKPLMIHCREAHRDVIDILSSYKEAAGNIHFFSGTWEQARRYFDLGFLISFAGPITFSNQHDETIKKAPLDKIMIETDSPFAAPVPYRGQRNEPMYVRQIAEKIASIRGISCEKVAEAATKNAIFLFLK